MLGGIEIWNVLYCVCGGSDISIRITVHDSTRTSRETFSSTQKKTSLHFSQTNIYNYTYYSQSLRCYFVHPNAPFWKFGRRTWWWWNTTFCLLFCMTVLHENLSCSDCRRTHTRSVKIIVLQWKVVQCSHFVFFTFHSLSASCVSF